MKILFDSLRETSNVKRQMFHQNYRFYLIDNSLCVIPHLPTSKAGLMRNLFYFRDSRLRGNDRLFSTQRFLSTLLTLIIFLTLILTSCTDAQDYSEEDIEICTSTFQLAVDENLQARPINDVIIEVGKSFIGTDYVPHTLEVGDDERRAGLTLLLDPASLPK